MKAGTNIAFFLVLSSQLCVLKTTDEVWDIYRLVILVQNSLFCMQKQQMRAGSHRDLKFWSKMGCFACKNHRWGLGPIETRNSGANHAVLPAQNDRWCLGPIENCYSGTNGAVLHAKTTDKGWDPQRLVILILGTLFCMQKITGEVWDL